MNLEAPVVLDMNIYPIGIPSRDLRAKWPKG
jgi:hypothetical protein